MRGAGTLVCTLVAAVGCSGAASTPRTTFDAGDAAAPDTDAGTRSDGQEEDAEAAAAVDADASAPDDASAEDTQANPATWSHIYNALLVDMSYASNCTGEGCHDPGIQKGLDFSTRSNGYATVQAKLVPGNPEGSTIVMKLESGEMPRARPSMPAEDLALIKAWIAAGAPND
jgi:hypothetical protein